jgi:hypothetical protein
MNCKKHFQRMGYTSVTSLPRKMSTPPMRVAGRYIFGYHTKIFIEELYHAAAEPA